MELRHYWRVLIRRRIVLRNTFLLVAFLGLLNVAYSYYGSQWKGETVIGVQVQQNLISHAVIDPQQAADANTGPVEDDLQNYAGTVQYFQLVSNELAHTYGIHMDWKTVGSSLQVFASTNGHSIHIDSPNSNQTKATDIVAAAAHQLIAYVPIYHNELKPQSPGIRTAYVERPTARHNGLSKPAIDFLLRVALGVVAGIVLAYLFEYLDDSIQDAGDVEYWMHLPTLGVIPGGRQARRARSA